MEFAEGFVLPVVALVLIFGTIFGIASLWLRTRNQQRMALIEKGLGAGLADEQRSAAPALRWAALLAGVAGGLLAGEVLARYTALAAWVSYLSMLLIGASVGLIIGNLLVRRGRV